MLRRGFLKTFVAAVGFALFWKPTAVTPKPTELLNDKLTNDINGSCMAYETLKLELPCGCVFLGGIKENFQYNYETVNFVPCGFGDFVKYEYMLNSLSRGSRHIKIDQVSSQTIIIKPLGKQQH